MTRRGTDNGDKWDRWMGHTEHLAMGIDFLKGCWACGLKTPKSDSAGQKINLTPREFSALVCLMQQPGRPLTRTDICNEAWKVGFEGLTNCVDVYMNYLRKKIDAGRSPLIHTVRGIGYKLAREDAAA